MKKKCPPNPNILLDAPNLRNWKVMPRKQDVYDVYILPKKKSAKWTAINKLVIMYLIC